MSFLRRRLVDEATISEDDYRRIAVTDCPKEAVESIRQTATKQFGLTYGPKAKRRWFL
jgi:hypothetical protein